MIKLLVNAGARVKAYPRERSWCVSPLHEAARLKRAGNCLCLTELGADPEVRMGESVAVCSLPVCRRICGSVRWRSQSSSASRPVGLIFNHLILLLLLCLFQVATSPPTRWRA